MRSFDPKKLRTIIPILLAVIILINSAVNTQPVRAVKPGSDKSSEVGNSYDYVSQRFDNLDNNPQISTNNVSTGTPMETGIYIVPAITNSHILFDTVLSTTSNEIAVSGSPGEYLSASFVVHTVDGISGVTAAISDLIGPTTIDNSAVNLRVVKVWYQAGVEMTDITHKQLTPELLLKDDSLVQIQGADNYVKYTDGTLHLVSGATQPEGDTPTVTQMPIQDASSLQPVDIPPGTNKQFWITLQIPSDAVVGNYSGTITLNHDLGMIDLSLTVLPINLQTPYLTYSIYYTGVLDSSRPNGTISNDNKSKTQLESELTDLVDHGVINPTSYQPFDQNLLGQVLSLRNSLGLAHQPLYYLGLQPWGYESIDQVKSVIAFASRYGVPSVYFYGSDEAAKNELAAQRVSWTNIRNAGGKIFVAGHPGIGSDPGNFATMGDIQDLEISHENPPTTVEAAKWHSVGHQIFSYGNPQCGEELPETYRLNYGLLLWQRDYDGAMDFAYQYGFSNIWNDFDSADYRDEVMAYPTMKGVIDTIQWEGFRQGVNDVRYLTTLLDAIKQARASGKDTSDAETYLAKLKSLDLSTLDLDLVRNTMISYILSLKPQLDHITVNPSNTSVLVGDNQVFTAQGYDSDNNPITGLTYSWSITHNEAGSINSKGMFTAGTAAGSYPSVIKAISGSISGTGSITVIPIPVPTPVPTQNTMNWSIIVDIVLFILVAAFVVWWRFRRKIRP
jgi:hypothetical protein